MKDQPGQIDQNAPITRGREPVVQLSIPASVCRALVNPVDYAVYVHLCLAFEERARNWGAPARTIEDLWRRMSAAGLVNSAGMPIAQKDVSDSLQRLQDAGLINIDTGGVGDVQ